MKTKKLRINIEEYLDGSYEVVKAKIKDNKLIVKIKETENKRILKGRAGTMKLNGEEITGLSEFTFELAREE